ncbi:MAG TPA: zinc-binding dehydrogenase, partial [Trebonia sp.]|nr:zinc-binding dehydrogenase [Trebonia sp.]
GPSIDWARRCVAFEGRIVVLGFTSGQLSQVSAGHLRRHNYTVTGLHLTLYRRQDPALLRQVHDELVKLYASGLIAPEIYRELPFDQAPAGLALLAGRQVIGRVVLRV